LKRKREFSLFNKYSTEVLAVKSSASLYSCISLPDNSANEITTNPSAKLTQKLSSFLAA
jgi:hypothetical protein